MARQMTVSEFNERYPKGTPVLFWPGERAFPDKAGSPGLPTLTRSDAWEMPSGQRVVKVEGYSGGIALTHIEPIAMVMDDVLITEEQLTEDDRVVKVWRDNDPVQITVRRRVPKIKIPDPIPDYSPGARAEPKEPKVYYCDGKCAKVEDLTEELDRVKQESAQRQQEIDRLQGVLRVNDLRLERERDNLTVFRGVIGQKETELANAEERIRNLYRLVESVSESEQAAKISSLQDMISTQHTKLVKAEGDLADAKRDLQKTKDDLSVARQSLDLVQQDLRDCQDERERTYEMLDPNTEIDDRTVSLPALVQDLISENQRLERDNKEKSQHVGCRRLESGLNKELREMTESRDHVIGELNTLRNKVLDIVRVNVVSQDDV